MLTPDQNRELFIKTFTQLYQRGVEAANNQLAGLAGASEAERLRKIQEFLRIGQPDLPGPSSAGWHSTMLKLMNGLLPNQPSR